MRFILALLFIWSGLTLKASPNSLDDQTLIEIFQGILKSDREAMKTGVNKESTVVANFNQIIEIIKAHGFPSLSNEYRKKKVKNCINDASQITFIHILQLKPNLLLNNGTINVMKIELESGRLPKSILEVALQIYQDDIQEGRIPPLKEKEQHYLDHALSEWGMVSSEGQN